MTLSYKTIYLIKEYAKDNDPSDTRKYIGQLTGLKKTARNNLYNKIFSGKFDNNLKFKTTTNSKIIEAKDVKTLDELIQLSEINVEEWAAKKFTANIYSGNIQVKAEFERKRDENAIKTLIDEFVEKAKNFAPQKFILNKTVADGKLLILNLMDLHLGKLACDAETGWGNFDIKLAKKFYLDAISDILSKSPTKEIETILLVVGSDLLHFDNEQGTTSKGTKLDCDTRWTKVYTEGCDIISDVISNLAQNFKVEVMVVTGNHGKLSEYALGSYIKAFFRNNPNVNVNNDPLDRKYFGFGTSLIGFAHGDEIKLVDLPLTLMRENQNKVSNYSQFFFLTGHTHTDKLLEIKGVKVMVCPALCPPDKWHSKHAFVGNIQTSQGLLFDKEDGLCSIIYSKPAPKIT